MKVLTLKGILILNFGNFREEMHFFVLATYSQWAKETLSNFSRFRFFKHLIRPPVLNWILKRL
jgi:hypothetical protein